jgi:preprotein translocase subunit SecF
MNKNIVLLAISSIFLIASIAFSYMQKKSFNASLERIKQEKFEVKEVASLQQLWKAKGIKSKIQKILNSLPSSKKSLTFERNKVNIKLKNLSDRELNKVLTKLAMLPIQFKNLRILRSGELFTLECLCVW